MSFDIKAHNIALESGITYYVPPGFESSGVKTGEKVSITSEAKEGKHE